LISKEIEIEKKAKIKLFLKPIEQTNQMAPIPRRNEKQLSQKEDAQINIYNKKTEKGKLIYKKTHFLVNKKKLFTLEYFNF